MTILIETDPERIIEFDYTGLMEQVVRCALRRESCPYEAEVSIVITDDETIHSLNKEYRKKDSVTDVLSFPMHTYDIPAAFDELLEEEGDFNPETKEILLGDILISYEQSLRQSEEYGHSIQRELAFLTAHSMLHLIGYDHETEDEREIMEQKQNEILNELGITRDWEN